MGYTCGPTTHSWWVWFDEVRFARACGARHPNTFAHAPPTPWVGATFEHARTVLTTHWSRAGLLSCFCARTRPRDITGMGLRCQHTIAHCPHPHHPTHTHPRVEGRNGSTERWRYVWCMRIARLGGRWGEGGVTGRATIGGMVKPIAPGQSPANRCCIITMSWSRTGLDRCWPFRYACFLMGGLPARGGAVVQFMRHHQRRCPPPPHHPPALPTDGVHDARHNPGPYAGRGGASAVRQLLKSLRSRMGVRRLPMGCTHTPARRTPLSFPPVGAAPSPSWRDTRHKRSPIGRTMHLRSCSVATEAPTGWRVSLARCAGVVHMPRT